MILNLPQCEARHAHGGKLLCRHPRMHAAGNIVSALICQGCGHAGEPAALKPVEVIEAQLAAELAKPPVESRPLPELVINPPEPCAHRGLNILRFELSQLYGTCRTKEAVFACVIHGECTLRRYKSGSKPACCLGCPDLKQPEAKAAIGSQTHPAGKEPVAGSQQLTTDKGLSSVTFGITAFERPWHLARLLASIQKFYPDARIVVADNGRHKAQLPANVKLLGLPFDCGLSAARNALIEQLETPYLLVLEDDFVFTAETQIERFVDVLEHHPEVGLVGGSLVHRGNVQDYAVDMYLFRGVLNGQKSTGQIRTTDRGTPYRLCDKVYNFFLARREMLADHRWPEPLKLAEHTPYFWEVKQRQKWLVAHCAAVRADHDQSGRSNEYNRHRLDFGQYVGKWYGMHGIGAFRQPKSLNNDYVQPDRPNVIVFGIGHSRTTVLTRMLAACGWCAHDADETFCEHRKVRELNDGLLLRKTSLDVRRTADMLQAMRSPWVIKDPRFVLTLDQWLPAISQIDHPPALLWIDRDLDELAASCERRGEIEADGKLSLPYQRGHTLASIYAETERQFGLYPWPKLHITNLQLQAAIALFKPPAADRMLVIPRVFHRIWLGGRPMSEEFARFGRGWMQMNPGWELRDWDEAAIEGLGSLQTGDLWKRARNGSQASDVLRYELLNRFGGVYLDTDFEALLPLENALGAMSFVVAEELPNVVGTAFVASVAHHPILRDVLKLLPQRMAANMHQAQATGPGMLTEVWRRYRREPGVRTYAPSYFYPYGWQEKHRRWDKFPGAIAAHHWAGSWTGEEKRRRQK